MQIKTSRRRPQPHAQTEVPIRDPEFVNHPGWGKEPYNLQFYGTAAENCEKNCEIFIHFATWSLLKYCQYCTLGYTKNESHRNIMSAQRRLRSAWADLDIRGRFLNHLRIVAMDNIDFNKTLWMSMLI